MTIHTKFEAFMQARVTESLADPNMTYYDERAKAADSLEMSKQLHDSAYQFWVDDAAEQSDDFKHFLAREKAAVAAYQTHLANAEALYDEQVHGPWDAVEPEAIQEGASAGPMTLAQLAEMIYLGTCNLPELQGHWAEAREDDNAHIAVDEIEFVIDPRNNISPAPAEVRDAVQDFMRLHGQSDFDDFWLGFKDDEKNTLYDLVFNIVAGGLDRVER